MLKDGENQESEENNEQQPEPETVPNDQLDESECDATIADLLDEIAQLTADNAQLRSELTALTGRLDEHHTTGHGQPEQQPAQLPEPEPVPDETHIWFKRIGGGKA